MRNETFADKLPLLRIDNDKWLREYARGHILLRSQLYYQSIEETDAARSDKLDGALPVYSSGNSDAYQRDFQFSISNQRIMNVNVFIECLFSYNLSNIQHAQDSQIILHLNEENIKSLKSFSKDSFLLIYDRAEFGRRIEKATSSKEIPCLYGNVRYINFSNYDTVETLKNEYMNGRQAVGGDSVS